MEPVEKKEILSELKKRKYERRILKLNKTLAIKFSKSEILNRLDVENHKLSNIQQKFRGM